MQKLGLNEIRSKFLKFFEEKDHLIMPSFPLLPIGDSSLLLINSGMAPLKPYFSGEAVPPKNRVATCQKCIRTPDIERVGKTSRHGTFFEMLGNFSFGDYFKREAISYAWEFITKVMEIPTELLYVSVYLDDDETWDIWEKEVGVDPSHLVRLGRADNFWEIGAGPCGPCSEIYFDRGVDPNCTNPDCAVGCDCDRYVEFWNLVFTQFSNDGNGNYTPLQKKNIDTGMGLERLACIMQGVGSLFDVDTVRNIMSHISDIAGVKYNENDKIDVSLRIITDHVRSTTMMISDGVMPSNEGRGYVLRRLLRRAARHGKLLGIDKPFLCQVSDTVIKESGQAYPNLIEKAEFIKRVIKIEEENFIKTIDTGLSLLTDIVEKAKGADKILSGDDVFKLSDTFGFPIDLTEEIAAESGVTIDRARFDELMLAQRERARAARSAMGDLGWKNIDFKIDKNVKIEFVGYSQTESKAKVLAIATNGEVVDSANEGDDVIIVLDNTPFYAESGGQIADIGKIITKNGEIEVVDVKKTADNKFTHIGKVISGQITKGDEVDALVDKDRRNEIRRAHSTTHLLQKALRSVLGTHVEQAGSFVSPDGIRFDFTHFSAMTEAEIAAVENQVNAKILEGLPITATEMPIDAAKKLGAMALFGEKYGDVVRVVQMGDYSTELCGGIHLENTAKAGLFKILSESSVASGVRRIEAIVGLHVFDKLNELNHNLLSASAVLKTTPGELAAKINQLALENRELQREIAAQNEKASLGDAGKLLEGAKVISGLTVVTAILKDARPDALRTMGDWLRDKDDKMVAVLAAVGQDKVTFAATCGKGAIEKGIKAGELVSAVAKIAGGSGGGRPDSAMAGGKDTQKADEALKAVYEYITERLG